MATRCFGRRDDAAGACDFDLTALRDEDFATARGVAFFVAVLRTAERETRVVDAPRSVCYDRATTTADRRHVRSTRIPNDPAARERMGNAARTRAEQQHDERVVVAKQIETYRRLL